MVFSRFIEDLKYLEETGILLDTGEFLKGTLVSITGDNVGSHFIGGLCEGFNAQYSCRYCSLSKSEICEVKYYKEGLYCTKERHMDVIQMLEESDSDHIEGFKFKSVFNSLVHFHVVFPGLPPCLGHDLFEGLVDYYLALFTDYFVQQKWFTYEPLNKNLNKFSFCNPDATNMLKAISKGKKI
ncbi:hypothetical protein HOLleu_37787 [Holothuria leucospilota]|uniref:Uncharacterized protein n=1 Tax=Holothuria leucospilota TaxID=206669 RepID=A0A9Q0YIJ3_HOLLE|nr:hypothetical protein HOLleu_37787 [Holothuria leucospilota]